jgi:uncharacterized protein YoxC
VLAVRSNKWQREYNLLKMVQSVSKMVQSVSKMVQSVSKMVHDLAEMVQNTSKMAQNAVWEKLSCKERFRQGHDKNGGVNFEKVSTVLIFNVAFDQWL